MKYDIKCDCCGKFISQTELSDPKSSYLFVPDSDVSYEEQRYRCVMCTSVYGEPVSSQFGMTPHL